MQSSLTLAQLGAAVGKDNTLFAVADTLTGRWRSVDTNTIRTLNQDGEYVSGELFGTDGERTVGNYDLKKRADGSFSGRYVGHLTCRYWCLRCFPARWIENSCDNQSEIVLTTVARNRIEGYVYSSRPPKPNDKEYGDFCKTCGKDFPKVKKMFVWVKAE